MADDQQSPGAGKAVRTRWCAALVVLGTLCALAITPVRAAEDQPAAQAQAEPVAPPESAPVDFTRDIKPILQTHCLKCHGTEMRRGGLRLDEREYAVSGGDSGKPIVAGPLAENELYQRVSSGDRTYRMPKNAPALPPGEIDLLKRWIESGADWPTPTEVATGKRKPSAFYERWFASVVTLADLYEKELAFAMPFTVAFLVFQVVLLVIGRAKRASSHARSWTTGRLGAFCRWSSRVTSREMLLAWSCALVLLTCAVMWGHQRRITAELVKARATQLAAGDPWSKNIFGFPPVPYHPDEPPHVSAKYYRGNCERNPELFNGGNYLTATFLLELCDAEHHTVGMGDVVPAGGLFVRLEIDRAPGTSETLFSREIMAAVFLTTSFYGRDDQLTDVAPLPLETLEKDQRWVVYYPIGPKDVASATNPVSGLIYVYTGRIEKGRVRGEPHYGVKYEIHIADGKVAAGSDLWMNSFGSPVFAPPELPGKLPYREWFDFRPLPVITGRNSQDPKLLGIEEYIQKGLLKPKAGAAPPEAAELEKKPDAPAANSDAPAPEKEPAQEGQSAPAPQ